MRAPSYGRRTRSKSSEKIKFLEQTMKTKFHKIPFKRFSVIAFSAFTIYGSLYFQLLDQLYISFRPGNCHKGSVCQNSAHFVEPVSRSREQKICGHTYIHTHIHTDYFPGACFFVSSNDLKLENYFISVSISGTIPILSSYFIWRK